MIISFADKETAKIFNGEISRKFPPEIQLRAQDRMVLMGRARKLDDLRIPPSNHLECLVGNRAGQYSIRINSQYRICFNWAGFHATDVEIVDYHR
ncbi:MAG: type II toxin-antitoxin system RelE/ParE family toxin [Rickettsiales bacterium]|nr:type II toxin-antitoxin system RelE/ParE family toxin [Rickettsiales bacterium]